ncbi:MAG TPA: ABC transporter ATP-binding protein [Bacillales bacterium]|nr:ABC transporter ATP-binding protein [Bacillales bacterium]
MSHVVEVNNLTKSFRKVTAVQDVSFSIEPNKIYGMLGRNGAGKTTIMHMLTAQQFETSGEVRVFGEHPYENQRVLGQICFIKESQRYPDAYRILDVLDVAGLMYPNWDREYAHDLVNDFQLPLKRRMKKLSRGMRSAVGIIIGLASRAPLTIFDEPYLGLDAVARTLFYDRLLEDYSVHPRTVILSTHLIDEISEILEHVMLIDKGRLIVDEDADKLRGSAFTIAGHKDRIEAFTAGRKVIAQTPLGALVSATVIGDMNSDDRKQAESLGLEPTPVSLQQMFVHLTNEKTNGKTVTV